jgi:hypothetical protein
VVTVRIAAADDDMRSPKGKHIRERHMAERGWKRPFEDPIPLSDGEQLRTLGEAGSYIMALPPQAKAAPQWQDAVEARQKAAGR